MFHVWAALFWLRVAGAMAFNLDFRVPSHGVELLYTESAPAAADELVCGNETNSIVFWFGWALFAAQIPFCYMPQYIKLVKAGTHIGMSLPNTICFALVAYLQLLTYVCSTFHETFSCCNLNLYNGWQCGYAMAPFLQTVTAWIGSTLIIYLYFYVFDRPGLVAKNFDPKEEYSACWRQVWATVFVHVVLTTIPIVLGITGGAVDAPGVLNYGKFASLAGSLLIACHWFLQMHETWRMQGIGSLSIFMCVFSVGGSLVSAVVFSTHENGAVVSLPFWVGTFSISMATIYALWVERNANRGNGPEWKGEGPAPLDPVSFIGRTTSGTRSFTGSQGPPEAESVRDDISLQPAAALQQDLLRSAEGAGVAPVK